MNSLLCPLLLRSRFIIIGYLRNLGILGLVCIVVGCGRTEETTTVEKPVASSESSSADNNVVLTPQEIDKLGIITTPAQAIGYTPEVEGYGVVLDHETIAQKTAEVAVARAAAQQSQAALKRMRQLADTPGALSQDISENIIRQAAVDESTLALAERSMTAMLGSNPAWQSNNDKSVLSELASGHLKLIRVTFPLEAISGEPTHLRITPLGTVSAAENWSSSQVWKAPADAALPGRSFFALLNTGNVSEGDHVSAWAEVGKPEQGVFIPGDAVVISEGAYWCYVEKTSGSFSRVQIDIHLTVKDGYFVEGSVKASELVVAHAASLLLARETGTVTESD